MQVLSRLTYPLIRALSAVTAGILALFGTRGKEEPQVTEEEINILMEQGADAGVFEKHEQALVARVFRLDELNVTGVMTPRSEIVTLDLEDSPEANIRRILDSGHSRFPVVGGEPNHIDGIVLTKALFEDSIAGKPFDLASRLVKPLFVPQTLTAMEVVAAFKKRRQTMALVVNEFGDLQGLVTLNDIMEALVGDIATVEDEADRDAVRRDDGSWSSMAASPSNASKMSWELRNHCPRKSTTPTTRSPGSSCSSWGVSRRSGTSFSGAAFRSKFSIWIAVASTRCSLWCYPMSALAPTSRRGQRGRSIGYV
jgi:CBS domain containing-hemolysin-like protein